LKKVDIHLKELVGRLYPRPFWKTVAQDSGCSKKQTNYTCR